jgi:hypothetical protein
MILIQMKYKRNILRALQTLCILLFIQGEYTYCQNPVIYTISESISPGTLLSIYGDFLADKPEIDLIIINGKAAARISPIQTDTNGQFLRAIFPQITPGVYQIRVSSKSGISKQQVYINKATPRWVSDERAYPGMKMKLFGRNLDASQYGGIKNSEIRLNPSNMGSVVVIKPISISSNAIEFKIPDDLKYGSYFVEVRTNSGGYGCEWIRLTNESEYPDRISDTQIVIEKTPEDPMAKELGVAWANDFNWGKVFNVQKEFNARGDGITDDTRALQAAVDTAAANGGGVVFLPNGTYNISGILLDKNIVIRGENNEKTILYFYKNSEDQEAVINIFESKGDMDDPTSAKRVGWHGICNLKVLVSPRQDKAKKLSFCELGCGRSTPWPPEIKYLTASGMFVFKCNIELGLSTKHWNGFEISGAGTALVAENKFVVGSPCWSHSVKEYFTIRNNSIDFVSEQVSASSDKFRFENNIVTGHLIPGVTGCLHGVFTNELGYGFNIWNSYLGNNEINNLNYVQGNDGEIFCMDSHPWLIKGRVEGYSPEEVIINEDFKKPETPYQYGTWHEEWMAVVYDGKGLGQLRRVTGFKPIKNNKKQWSIEVNKSWDLQPDSTSKIAIGRFHTGVVIENNTSSNCCNSILLYNGCIDNIVANNKLTNTLGILIHGWQLADGYPGMSFFNQVRGNSVSGMACRFDNAWIGERGEDFAEPQSGVSLYGNEFRANSIDREKCFNHKDYDSRSPGGFVSSQVKGHMIGRSMLAPLYENNTVLNSFYGVSINDGSVTGAIIKNNKCIKVSQNINDRGSGTIIIQRRLVNKKN